MPVYEVTADGVTYEVDSPTDLSEAQAWAAVKPQHEARSKRMREATATDQAKQQAAFAEGEAARPWAERAITNIGAGMDTAWQGAKQLGGMVGLGSGVSDEELAEQRRMKGQLAEGTTGGGLLQTAGEVLPTLAIPGGAAATTGRALAGAVGGGALAGALQPVLSTESRAANVALGGAGGAAGVGLGKALGKGVQMATRGGREEAALQRGGKALRKTLGPQADAAEQALRQFHAGRVNAPAPGVRGVTQDIPMSTAQAVRMGENVAGEAGSGKLAGLELANRAGAADDFAELARRQNEALFEATQRAGVEGTPQQLTAATTARDLATAPLRQDALQAAGRWPEVGAPLQAQTAALRGSSAAGTPSRRLADLVDQTLTENPTPEQLYSLRKMLANKLNGPMTPGDDVAAIVKGAERDAYQMMQAIDARLNEAARRKGGAAEPWSDYLQTYTEKSRPVTSARAQQQIGEAMAPEGGPIVGATPEITRHRLAKAVERFGRNKQGFERLTPDASARYGELLDTMQRMEEPMRAVKLGGTGGGGSQTATQTAMQRGATALNAKVPFIGDVYRMLTQTGQARAKQEMAQLMLDPQRAMQAIQAAQAAGRPLSQAQQMFMLTMRAGGGSGAAALLQAPAE